MSANSVIDINTVQAFMETEYRVHGHAQLTLRVGAFCSELAELHKASNVESSAFITACNPFSQPLDDSANTGRQASLAGELVERNFIFIDGIGQHPSNQWPGEPSFLVLGMSLETAKTLGANFGQNAILWSGPDAIPQLVLLR